MYAAKVHSNTCLNIFLLANKYFESVGERSISL